MLYLVGLSYHNTDRSLCLCLWKRRNKIRYGKKFWRIRSQTILYSRTGVMGWVGKERNNFFMLLEINKFKSIWTWVHVQILGICRNWTICQSNFKRFTKNQKGMRKRVVKLTEIKEDQLFSFTLLLFFRGCYQKELLLCNAKWRN